MLPLHCFFRWAMQHWPPFCAIISWTAIQSIFNRLTIPLLNGVPNVYVLLRHRTIQMKWLINWSMPWNKFGRMSVCHWKQSNSRNNNNINDLQVRLFFANMLRRRNKMTWPMILQTYLFSPLHCSFFLSFLTTYPFTRLLRHKFLFSFLLIGFGKEENQAYFVVHVRRDDLVDSFMILVLFLYSSLHRLAQQFYPSFYPFCFSSIRFALEYHLFECLDKEKIAVLKYILSIHFSLCFFYDVLRRSPVGVNALCRDLWIYRRRPFLCFSFSIIDNCPWSWNSICNASLSLLFVAIVKIAEGERKDKNQVFIASANLVFCLLQLCKREKMENEEEKEENDEQRRKIVADNVCAGAFYFPSFRLLFLFSNKDNPVMSIRAWFSSSPLLPSQRQFSYFSSQFFSPSPLSD